MQLPTFIVDLLSAENPAQRTTNLSPLGVYYSGNGGGSFTFTTDTLNSQILGLANTPGPILGLDFYQPSSYTQIVWWQQPTQFGGAAGLTGAWSITDNGATVLQSLDSLLGAGVAVATKDAPTLLNGPVGAEILMDLFGILLNGLFVETNAGDGSLTTRGCPCNPWTLKNTPSVTGSLLCDYNLWKVMADGNTVQLPGGALSTAGPCLDAGQSMTFSVNAPPFLSLNSQVVRVANLDKLLFEDFTVNEIPCRRSLGVSFVASGCPNVNQGGAHNIVLEQLYWRPSVITMWMSLQGEIMGNSIRPPSDPTQNGWPCLVPPKLQPTDNDCAQLWDDPACFEVRIPNPKFYVNIEIPTTPASFTGCGTGTAWLLNLADPTVSVQVGLDDPPVLPLDIAPENRAQVNSLVLAAANTFLSATVSTMIREQLTSALQNQVGVAQIISQLQIAYCTAWEPALVMECGASSPTIPATCNTCDACCICAASGNCEEKCFQQCPCVRPFCAAANRVFNQLWWKILWIGAIVALAGLAIVAFMMKAGHGGFVP